VSRKSVRICRINRCVYDQDAALAKLRSRPPPLQSTHTSTGVPADGVRRWNVPLADVRVDAEVLAAVQEAVASGWWSMGPRVAEFEVQFATYCGAEHALAVANGTAALHLAVLALGCGAGDEVVLPSLNFVAAANAVAVTGATPVFCDITDETDLNLSPEDLEAAITPATKAVIVLHYGGNPCRMDAVLELAEGHGVAVIEDAAHAPGATWRGRHCGTLGRIGCFSFFSNKNLPTGEGGAVLTDDEELVETIRLLRSHGMTSLTWDRQRGHAHAYDVVTSGFNYRLDEIRAAIALVELGRLETENAARRALAERYRKRLDGVGGLVVPFSAPPDDVVSSQHLAVVVLPEGTSRPEVRAALANDGIQTSVHYPPIHTFTRYAGSTQRRLPVTDAIAERLLTLPLFGHMTEEQNDLVAERLLAAL
jgi:dTDP-4-amino-4,6-dideoxygalactose transaminase